MKTLLSLSLLTRFAIASFAVTTTAMAGTSPIPGAPPAPLIDAPAWVVIDYHTGQVLAEQSPDERREPASLTKMMTSYVLAAEVAQGRVSLTDTAVVSEKAWRLNKNASENSLMFLEVGKQVSLDDLHKGIIIQSGNDASIVVAEHVAGSEEAYASLMNQYAKKLGLHNSHFMNATGLPHPEHYSSARDMAQLGVALIRDFPEDYRWYSEKEFEWNGIKQPNRNSLLWDTSLAVDGIKTGHTSSAGFCLVSSATQSGMRLVVSLLGSKNMATRAVESKKLLTWAFRNFDTVQAVKAGEPLTRPRVWYGDSETVEVGLAQPATLVLPRGRRQDLKANYSLLPDLQAPVAKGQVVGKLFLQLDGKDIAEHPLVALKDVPEGGVIRQVSDWFAKKFVD
jgi:serine-type D-Ala-D-Ala carboxypeptidase (penicillin-binding protein 5/6)